MADDVLPSIISRKAAKAAGLSRYFTGKECSRGHVAERFVHNAGCVECHRGYRPRDVERSAAQHRARSAAYAARNPEKSKARAAAYLDANRERLKAKKRAERAANPEKFKAARAAYYAANAKRENDRKRDHYAKHREEEGARCAAWREANPEKIRAINRNRRARLRAAEGFHTDGDIAAIHQAQDGRCAYCKVKLRGKYHVDHIQPLVKGGSNWPRNLQLLCQPCNNGKYSKDPLDHARDLGLLL